MAPPTPLKGTVVLDSEARGRDGLQLIKSSSSTLQLGHIPLDFDMSSSLKASV